MLTGVLAMKEPIHLGPIDPFLDVISVLVLVACILMAVRRYFFMKERLTHPVESGLVLSLISGLMITYMLERPTFGVNLGVEGTAAKINWWVHYLILCGFPSLIAWGKHLHLLIAPINVVLKHMTELPSDRPISGGDFEMPEDEDLFEAEYARVGMPNGVADFSFHSLFDTAACIECGRCNDACPSAGAGLSLATTSCSLCATLPSMARASPAHHPGRPRDLYPVPRMRRGLSRRQPSEQGGA